MSISEYPNRLRQAIGDYTLLVPNASVVIRDEANRVLLQQRTDNHEWCLPGGAMDLAESIAQVAIREVCEETGIKVEFVRLFDVYSDPSQIYTYENCDKIQAIVILFEGNVIFGTLMPDFQETLRLAYFTIEALSENLSKKQYIRILGTFANRPESFSFDIL